MLVQVLQQQTQGTVRRSPDNAPSSQFSTTFATAVTEVPVAADDLEAATSGWTVGAAGDNATAGLWVRGNPLGTFSSSTPIQPEDDRTPAPGTTCWFTGQGSAGGGLGDAVLRECERIAREDWRLPAMRMTVIDVREELIAWYERRGYRRTGIKKPFPYGDTRFGQPKRDDLRFEVLEKPLRDPGEAAGGGRRP